MLKYLFIILCSLICFQIEAFERFPSIEPNVKGMLQVDDLHAIYWEESGNPNGIPVIFLHGGPGSKTDKNQRTFFDPNFYRIILFDQRGCGKSYPNGCLINNTTWDLVEDINRLRHELNIDQCLLFGGSWGSTLALTYAITYPENVLGLILRGIFLCTPQELDYFYRDGANHLSPKAWKIFNKPIPENQREDLIAAYHHYLNVESQNVRRKAAASWVLWEFANSQAKPDSRLKTLLNSKVLFYIFSLIYSKQNQTMARIENHYFFNRGFFETDNWILENIHKIQHIPGIIVQGECDRICPWPFAQKLHQAWPSSSTFFLIPNAGHSAEEPSIQAALIEATEHFKHLFKQHHEQFQTRSRVPLN